MTEEIKNKIKILNFRLEDLSRQRLSNPYSKTPNKPAPPKKIVPKTFYNPHFLENMTFIWKATCFILCIPALFLYMGSKSIGLIEILVSFVVITLVCNSLLYIFKFRAVKKECNSYNLEVNNYNRELRKYRTNLREYESKNSQYQEWENRNEIIKKKEQAILVQIKNLELIGAPKIPNHPFMRTDEPRHIPNIPGQYSSVLDNNYRKSNSQLGIIELAKAKIRNEVINIQNRNDLTDDQKVIRICTVFSTTCAAIAVQPIPFADIFVLTPIQAFMGKKIAEIRGYNISDAGATEVVKEVAGLVGMGFLSQQLAIGAYKTVLPFVSGVTTIPLVFGLTYGMGKVMDYYFIKKINGQDIDPNVIKSIFTNAKTEGKRKAKENKEEIQRQKNSF